MVFSIRSLGRLGLGHTVYISGLSCYKTKQNWAPLMVEKVPKEFGLEVCDDMEQSIAITSQLQRIDRAMYNSPPLHGILFVSTILTDPAIKELWIKEVKDRIMAIHDEETPHFFQTLINSNTSLSSHCW
ncbi:uncharacterized protein [Euphorbia lathyris]|uniref:uncharacterized protein n=1 Tax=Euphorbia lathyris TaxID=212925 RepID=UPI0033144417